VRPFEYIDQPKFARLARGNRKSHGIRGIPSGEPVTAATSVTAIAHLTLVRFRRRVKFSGRGVARPRVGVP
jgi:hypothetical protein